MADDLDDINFDDDDMDFDSDWDSPEDGAPESRDPVTRISRNVLEGAIGGATDNNKIKETVKNALPKSLQENWETADDLIDVADKAKDTIINPIRKEMVSFKRNMNKLAPLVTRYLGEGLGTKYDELTQTREESTSVDPDTQELVSTVGGIFSEEAKARVDSENKKLVLDMMARQTDEDRFKLQITTMHDMMSSIRRMDEYNRTINYSFQQKSLEYDIKRFHLLRQILEVNKSGAEASDAHLKAIVHNTSLPELVKQQSSELFQQMFVEKWYGDTVDNVMGMGRGMMRKFGKNLVGKAKETSDNIVDGMRQVGDMADLVGGLTENGVEEETSVDPKQAIIDSLSRMAGNDFVDRSLKKIIAEAGLFVEDREWAKDLVARSDNMAQNKNLFFKTFLEDMSKNEDGILGKAAPIFQMLLDAVPETERAMTSMKHLNSFKPTDPRQWDHQQRETVVDIIPGWLEKIHNLIADIYGRGSNNDGYDSRSGRFVDKTQIKKGILDAITTDEERTEAITEVDGLIDYITQGMDGVDGNKRQLMREWMIREASTTSNLDIRKLLDADSFEGLNSSNADDAKTIADALSGIYDKDTLYKYTKGDRDSDTTLSTMNNRFTKVNRKYKDDQDILNNSITGGRRGLLAELGLLNVDGSYNELAILKHKLGGISPDADATVPASVRDAYTDAIDNPTPSPTPVPVPTGMPPNVAPSNTTVPNSRIPSGTPPDTVIPNPVIDTSIFNDLLTDNMFNKRMAESIELLQGIETNTKSTTPIGLGFRPMSTVSPLINDGTGDIKAHEYLSGILTTLSIMHSANISYYDNVKEFELNRHGLGTKISNLIGKGFDFLGSGAKFVGDKLKTMIGFGTLSIGAIKDGFNNNFSFDRADVYVGDEDTPRITANDFRNRPMYIRTNGEVDNKRITRADQIVGEVVDENLMTIITQDEYDSGMIRINRDGVFKRLGGMFGKLATMGFNAADGTINLSSKAFDMLKTSGKFVTDTIHHNFLKFKDTYILDENGNPKLLGTMADFRDGKLLYELDGQFHVVTDMADLLKGHIYRRDSNGTPVVVATVEDIRRGLVDITGKAINIAGGMFDKARTMAKTGLDFVIGAAKLPFTVLGNTWANIKSKFESKLLDKVVLNIPKDVLINASVVYLNNQGGKSRKGKRRKDRPEYNKATGAKADDSGVVNPIDNVVAKSKETIVNSEAGKWAKAKYDKLNNSNRANRAKEFMKTVAKDPIVLSNVINEAYKEHAETTKEPLGKSEFTKKYLKDTFGKSWGTVSESLKDIVIDDDGSVRNKDGVITKVSETSSIIKERFEKTEAYKKVEEKITNNETIRSVKKRVDDVKAKIGMPSIKDDVSTTIGDLLNKSALVKKVKAGLKPTTGNEFNDTYDKLVSYGRKDKADAYFAKLKDDPLTLKDVIEDSWNKHVESEKDPIDKDAFIDAWLVDKFGIDAPSVLENLNEADESSLSDQAKSKLGSVKSLMGKLGATKLGDKALNTSFGTGIKDKLGLGRKDNDLTDDERRNLRSNNTGDGTTGGLHEITDFLKAKFSKNRPEVRGDVDGDGDTDGSWRDILAKRKAEAVAKKDAKKAEKAAKRADDGSGKNGLLAMILAGMGTLVGGIGSVVTSIGSLGSTLVKFGGTMLKGITKGAWDVGKFIVTSLAKGMFNFGKKGNKKLGELAGKGLTKLKNLATPVLSAAKRSVGTLVRKGLTQIVSKVAPALLAASNPIGWAVAAAAATYTAWEVSSAAWGIYERRKDIKMMEYLRHLEYGMVSGNEGAMHKNKISLRYFENSIIEEAKVNGGVIEIGLTPNEVWRKYRGDFEDDGGDENAAGFIKWYEGRFLPVLYKWMSLVHKFDDAYKAQQEEPIFGSKDNLALCNLDDALSKELKAGIAKQSLQYPELKHDPLEIMASPSSVVVCSTRRIDAESFVGTIIKSLKPKVVDSHAPPTPKELKEIAKNKTKEAALKTMHKPKRDSAFKSYNENMTTGKMNLVRGSEKGGFKLTPLTTEASKANYLDFIKAKEGFSSKAYWDHKQWTIGFGTRTNDAAEIKGKKEISEEEAHRRLVEYTDKDREYIKQAGEDQGLTWADRELDALTSFTYNLGRGNLAKLIRGRDKDQITRSMLKYNKASGRPLPALVTRRGEEVAMFNSAKQDVTPPLKAGETVKTGYNLKKTDNGFGYEVEDPNTRETKPVNAISVADKVLTPAGDVVDGKAPVEVAPDTTLAAASKVPTKDTGPANDSMYKEAYNHTVPGDAYKYRASNYAPTSPETMAVKTDTIIDNTVINPVKVDLSGMPTNAGVESKMDDANSIAAETLNTQIKTNENMETLINLMAGNVVGSDVVATPTTQSVTQPPRAMGSRDVKVPMSGPVVNNKAKYK